VRFTWATSAAMSLINPLLESQPYEEVRVFRSKQHGPRLTDVFDDKKQGRDRAVSPHELQQFYRQQEAQDLQRRTTRRSVFSRKSFGGRSVKSSSTGPASPTQEKFQHSSPNEKPVPTPGEERDNLPFLKRKHGEWSRTAPFLYKTHYEIYNPVGPRWYMNHHLRRKGIARITPPPPTAFATQSTPNELTPSPLTTPTITPQASAISLPQRRRKISLTSPQVNIDMLDGTDPWGQNYHHDSPYDVGLEAKDLVRTNFT
jgi:hypothetical protein